MNRTTLICLAAAAALVLGLAAGCGGSTPSGRWNADQWSAGHSALTDLVDEVNGWLKDLNAHCSSAAGYGPCAASEWSAHHVDQAATTVDHVFDDVTGLNVDCRAATDATRELVDNYAATADRLARAAARVNTKGVTAAYKRIQGLATRESAINAAFKEACAPQ